MNTPSPTHVSRNNDEFVVLIITLLLMSIGPMTLLFLGGQDKAALVAITGALLFLPPAFILFYRAERAKAVEKDRQEAAWRCALSQQQIPDSQRD